MRRTLSIGLPLATFAVIAAAWQMLATYGGFPPKLVPGLGKIAEAFVRLAATARCSRRRWRRSIASVPAS